MASRVPKPKPSHREFLKSKGVDVTGLVAVGFKFESEGKAHIFHFKMMEAHFGHEMFDCVGKRVAVVLPESRAQECKDLAHSMGGVDFSATTIL